MKTTSLSRVWVLILLLTLANIPLLAQDSLNIHRIGSFLNLWQGSYRVEVQGDYAYVCAGRSGLEILDVSDPSNIQSVGRIATYGSTSDIRIVDTLAYVVSSEYGLRIYSIVNPAHPRFLSGYNSGGSCVVIVDTIACVGGGSVTVLNIADPNNVQLIANLERQSISSMFYADGYLYCTNSSYSCRFTIVCVDPPDSPHVTYSREIDNFYKRGIFARDSLLLLTRSSSVGVYNVSDKSNPIEIGRIRIENGYSIAVFDSLLLITGENVIDNIIGLNIVNISDPSHPVIVRTIPSDRLHFDLARDEDKIYLTDLRSSMGILDLSDMENPQWLGVYSTDQQCAMRINSHDNLVCINSGEKIWLADFTDFEEPELLSTLQTENMDQISGKIFGDYLYNSFESRRTDIYNISDPRSPEYIRTRDWGYSQIHITEQVGLCQTGNNVEFIDLSNPEDPVRRACYNTPDSLRIISIAASYPYMVIGTKGHYSYLDLFRIDNIDSLQLLCHQRQLDDFKAVAMCNKEIFTLTSDYNGIICKAFSFDEDDYYTEQTDQISLDYRCSISDDTDICVTRGHLFITIKDFGLSIIDATDIYHLKEVANYLTPCPAHQLAVLESGVVVCEETCVGIYNCNAALKVKKSPVIPFILDLQSYPNPFNSFTYIPYQLPCASQVSLKVFDITGREIETLVDKHLEAGEYMAAWHGINAPAGLYFCRMEAEGFTKTRKLILMK